MRAPTLDMILAVEMTAGKIQPPEATDEYRWKVRTAIDKAKPKQQQRRTTHPQGVNERQEYQDLAGGQRKRYVTIDNFNEVLEDIRYSFEKAKFITLDTEFSALNFSEKVSNSLFDTPNERYQKLRTLCEQIVPMQIGISAFSFNAGDNSYTADMYTFYVFPKKFYNINSTFVFQASSLQFLCSYNFDFNKFVYKGIPYINRIQETEIRSLENESLVDTATFHDSLFDNLIQQEGWDSYCTGYIFIRMAHISATNRFPTKMNFMNSELFASINHIKNCVNLIRCSVSHIKLDGNDPDSKRPPCLIIESVKDEPLDLLKISSLLTPYGFVEIKPYSRGGRRAIAAVDTFSSARRILRRYKKHEEFQVKQYSLIKHSSTARAAIWGGVLVSGIILALLTRSVFKN
ncbi:hypothetical protein Trydic_g10995 [Trypoxylus dichotomus]